jgi:hypothetical protein
MEPVFQFSYKHNDKNYLIKIEKAHPIHHRVSVFSEDSAEPLYMGFEHPQSFSKLFRSKSKLSPVEFRQSFN